MQQTHTAKSAPSCSVHVAHRPAPRCQWSGKRRTQLHAAAAPVVTKDVTADIMEGAIKIALKSRLRQHKGIDASVVCDAWGVLDGRFDNMSIIGTHWETPLQLTAHRLEVDIGSLQVDYSSLVWERKVALKNMPRGHTRIVLSGKDLGNFVTHPIFKQVAATAVQGHAFDFDPETVAIQHGPQGGGEVVYEGLWHANGERYKVLMRPSPRNSGKKGQLQVGALHLKGESGAADTAGAQEVAAGMAHFFTHMAIDLEGIELQSPTLAIHPAAAYSSVEGDLLDIGMNVRIRALPPLDMQF